MLESNRLELKSWALHLVYLSVSYIKFLTGFFWGGKWEFCFFSLKKR